MNQQPDSSPPTPSSSNIHSWSYDVFLSFRGKDTRYDFTGNLYKSLTDKGICTFIDDRDLKGGDEITPSLLKAIKESRIAIVILSENYAFSSFCLVELATIMEFVKGEDRLVYPIFYDLEPNVVRYQKEYYGEAMAAHEERFKDEMDKVDKWRDALRQVADLSGKVIKKGNDYEHVYIENITKVILSKIPHAPLHVTEYPVGLDSRVQEVNGLLNINSHSEVIMIGIYGMGGIGKTTLAKAVYNSIVHKFEGICFLEQVRETAKNHGLKHLQELVISKLLKSEDKVASVSEGKRVLQSRLSQKKVLLVLDDVNDREQLTAIAGSVNWFGSGSRVIVTTRDIDLLRSHGIATKYEVYGLRDEEAHKLFSWYAFKCINIDPSYKDISKQAVTYARGLPLALEVIGSDLRDKCIQEMNLALARYKRIPHKDIQKILQISFDSLEEVQKKLFLDIACCFIGYVWSEMIYKLQACYDDTVEHEVYILVKKSLLKNFGWVTTHDLIRDMAREIDHLQLQEHGKYRRLWSAKDIIQVLKEDSGYGQIEIIILDAPKDENEVVECDGNAFMKMENLKILIIKNVYFSQGANSLPNSLRVLEWKNPPSNLFSCAFRPNKGKFNNLKVLEFDDSDIFEIPDLSSVSHLEKLSFKACKNLTTVHESVGLLHGLCDLDASGCIKLEAFPDLKLPCLESLCFDDCSILKKFPEILCNNEKLTELSINGASIQELPPSVTKLRRLEELIINEVEGIVRIPSCIFSMLPSLRDVCVMEVGELQCLKQDVEEGQGSSTVSSNATRVTFKNCNMLDESVVVVLAFFRNVVSLDLAGNSFTILPESIKELCSLRKLLLDDCKKLEEIREIPPSVQLFSAVNCMFLSPSSRSKLLDKELHSIGEKMYCFPGNSYPEWLDEHTRDSTTIHLWFRNKLPPLYMCYWTLYL